VMDDDEALPAPQAVEPGPKECEPLPEQAMEQTRDERSRKHRSKDRVRDKDRQRDRDHDRDKHRRKDKDKDNERVRDKDKDRHRSRDRRDASPAAGHRKCSRDGAANGSAAPEQDPKRHRHGDRRGEERGRSDGRDGRDKGDDRAKESGQRGQGRDRREANRHAEPAARDSGTRGSSRDRDGVRSREYAPPHGEQRDMPRTADTGRTERDSHSAGARLRPVEQSGVEPAMREERRGTRGTVAAPHPDANAALVDTAAKDGHNNGEVHNAKPSTGGQGPLSLEDVLKRKQAAEAEAAKPKFLSKKEREALALERYASCQVASCLLRGVCSVCKHSVSQRTLAGDFS
jgi:hypothetical protein